MSTVPFPGRTTPLEAANRLRAGSITAAGSAAWLRQQQHLDTLRRAAAADAYDRGERAGFVYGWHWGMVSGICVGSIAVGALWAFWPQVLQSAATAAEWLLVAQRWLAGLGIGS